MLAGCAHVQPLPTHVIGEHVVLLSPGGPPGTRSIYTLSSRTGGRTGWYYDWGELAGLQRPNAKRVVLLGLGGGEMLRAAKRHLPDVEQLVGVELDPAIAETARSSFHVEQLGVQIVVEDAASWLARQPNASIDVLLVDVYDNQVLPKAFRTPAFYAEARRVVGARGAVLQNVWPETMLHQVGHAMHAGGFPEACAIDALHGNFVIWAGELPRLDVEVYFNLASRRGL